MRTVWVGTCVGGTVAESGGPIKRGTLGGYTEQSRRVSENTEAAPFAESCRQRKPSSYIVHGSDKQYES